MSATYNWTYRPGVTNKYGLVIADGDDDVPPSNAAYVALFGNDETGNGSRMYPYRTISHAVNVGNDTVVIGSGVYRNENSLNGTFIGDGNVVFDLFPYLSIHAVTYNIKIKNVQSSFRIDQLIDCMIEGDGICLEDCYQNGNLGSNTIFKSIGQMAWRHAGPLNNSSGYNTFINIANIDIQTQAYGSGANSYGKLWFSIYDGCNIQFEEAANLSIDYCLFNNCAFRVGDSNDFVPINNITDLISLVQTFAPGNQSFTHSIFADPKFNNPEIGDYSLAFDSPAKNLSYWGTSIGAKSIGQPLKARSAENDGGFELNSAINLTVNDDSITLTDTTLDAQIDTKVIVNLQGRELASLPVFGFNADRNGQYIDSIPDLSSSVYNDGDSLPSFMPFIVEVGAINYNGNSYQPGDRGTTTDSVNTFSTSESGVMREITEAPQRQTIMARFSDGGESVSPGDDLTDGYYYYVTSESITYNSIDFASGTIFKASGTTPFSGTGMAVIAFADQAFQHYEPNIRPTSNNASNSRTGEIIRGNGDPAYVRGGLGIQEFPINAKFIQLRYYIRVNNLKP